MIKVEIRDDYDNRIVGVATFDTKEKFEECKKALNELRDEKNGYPEGLVGAYRVIRKFGSLELLEDVQYVLDI